MEIELSQIEDGYEDFWSSLTESKHDWVDEPGNMRKRALTYMLDHIKDGRIIDLGCGDGKALRALSKSIHSNLYGADISTFALSSARQYANVVKADLTHIPISDSSFSCILLLDVFEHVVNKDLLMKEVHRILSNDGIVVMTTPLPKATDGHGDLRQPHDVPLEFEETMAMVSPLFRIDGVIGYPVMPFHPLFSVVEEYIPFRLWVSLFDAFPMLFDRADEIMIVLRKRSNQGE